MTMMPRQELQEVEQERSELFYSTSSVTNEDIRHESITGPRRSAMLLRARPNFGQVLD
jgi:hypothetical protein